MARVAATDDQLQFDGQICALSDVRALVERHSPWTGRSWLDVVGPGWRIPIDDHHGELRALLFARLPHCPRSTDWGSGVFPSAPFGLPAHLALTVGVTVSITAMLWTSVRIDAMAGLALGLASALPLARLGDTVEFQRRGLRIGPRWAPRWGWHEVDAVEFAASARRVRVWARGPAGGAWATIPPALLPALRGRLRRLGALELAPGDPDGLDVVYERWRAVATAIPWGVLVGTAAAAGLAPDPWIVLLGGVLTMAATGMLAAAVEARVTGWGTGAVLWVTAAWAVVLAAFAVGGLLAGQ